MKDVAVIVDNMVQFFSIKNGLDDLSKQKVSYDIYVPLDSRRPDEQKDTCRMIEQLGYKTLKKHSGGMYRIVMEPHPQLELKPELSSIKFIYRIKYKYSLTTAKPKPVYSTKWNLLYDAILTYSKFETDILRPYSETYQIFPVKYRKLEGRGQISKKGTKKSLLYMPTFNDDENIDTSKLKKSLIKLSKEYNLAVKVHQGIQYRAEQRDFFEFLEKLDCKKYYQDSPLDEIMKSTDVILTGNSGSIYEAMYMGKPVAIFAKDIEKYTHIVDPYHLILIKEGVLKSTNKEENIPETIRLAIVNFKNQEAKTREQFLFDEKDEGFAGVIKKFVARSETEDYPHMIKAALVKRHFGKRDNFNEIIQKYELSLSWKLTKPLRFAKYHLNKIVKG